MSVQTTTAVATPNLKMNGTHYGVAVADIGIDDDAEGTIFALGHVDPRRALAAFQRHARHVWGMDLHDDRRPLLDDALRRVEQLWMVNLGTSETWCLEQAEPTTPGAFPVTWWSA